MTTERLPKRFVVLVPAYSAGGIQTYCANLSRELDRRGHEGEMVFRPGGAYHCLFGQTHICLSIIARFAGLSSHPEPTDSVRKIQ